LTAFRACALKFGVARLHLLQLLGGDRISDDGAFEPIGDRYLTPEARFKTEGASST